MKLLLVRPWMIGRVLAVVMLASSLSPVFAQSEADSKKAVAAAEAFVALIDAGKYAESWDGRRKRFAKR